MKLPYIILILSLILVSAVLAFVLLKPKEPTEPVVKLPSEQIAEKPDAKNLIIIDNFAFTPNVLNIQPGESVTWFNEDGVVHMIQSEDFASIKLKNDDSFTYQFPKQGTYGYHCKLHPYMSGKIVVQTPEH